MQVDTTCMTCVLLTQQVLISPKLVTAMQALFALDARSAQEAMLQFQSCVRTTLLLADGYECQEKVRCMTYLPVHDKHAKVLAKVLSVMFTQPPWGFGRFKPNLD